MGVDTMRRGIVGTGLAFIILFVVAGLLLGELFGAFADSDTVFQAYFSGHAHHTRDLVGGHLFVASALALLLFLQLLTRQLRALGGEETGLQMANASGVVAVTLLLVGTAATLTVTMAEVFGRITGDEPLTNPSVALAPQLGYVLIFFPAMWATSLTVGLITWSVWHAQIWPRWGRWLAVTAAALLLTSWVTFMFIAVLPAWVLGVSLWAWRSSHREPEHADPSHRRTDSPTP